MFYGKLMPVAVLLLVAEARAAGPIVVVENGQTRAEVVLPADAAEQVRPAATLLLKYVKQSSGAELPLRIETDRATSRLPVTIHLGLDAYAKAIKLGVEKLDADGFVIRVDPGHVVLAGPTADGTEFAVCDFLERYVGVRWLLPGPDGDDVPQTGTIRVPTGEVRQEPAFFSRQFSGLVGEAQATWARRNRMHARVSFHHNLVRLFPPEKYTTTHPEFFPVKGGQRFLPASSSVHAWQPCCSASGIVEEAIKNICDYFRQHPEATSYSLGVNDSSGHCQCEACQSRDPGGKNFLGYRDVSDRYFEWCNHIVEGVLKQYPDKYFGCLAYSEVGQAPSRVKVHPRIIPFMTYDRMKWIHPELRADGQRMTQRWHEVSPVLGWYDYIYGSPYCLPRVWFHQMADYYRFGHANGVRALYAEAYPNWGEGPKLYVSLKLQWDPKQDVDALLRDWYSRAVGPEAAADLGAYYARWEDFWTRRILDSKWFSRGGQYLSFNSTRYLENVTDEDMVESRRLLESVVAKAQTAPQKARAALLLRAFEYYEASAAAHARRAGPGMAAPLPRTEDQALALVASGIRCLEMAQKREHLVEVDFAKHPVLVHPLAGKHLPPISGEGAGSLWAALDWAAKSDAVRRELRRLADLPEGQPRLHSEAMLAVVEGRAQQVSQNSSFEELQGRWPAAWRPWVRDAGKLTAAPEAAHSGKLGIRCRGVTRGGPYQDLQADPGRYAATAWVAIRQDPGPKATVTLNITPIDEEGKNMPSLISTVQGSQCDWTRLAVGGDVPTKTAKGVPMKKLRVAVIVDGLEKDQVVDVDDLTLYRIP